MLFKVFLALSVAVAILGAYLLGLHRSHSQVGTQVARNIMYYVDPMHPSYKSDKPGVAPDCGMRLEPVYSIAVANAPRSPDFGQLPKGAVSIDGATRQLLAMRIAPVEKNGAARTIRAVGRVIPEDTRVYSINSGVDGFVRETFNDSVGVFVKKDQKLATYYAPDFLSASSGFLAASERVPGSAAKEGARSIQNYTDRLRNLGMSDSQIHRMVESRQLPESIDVVAPSDGFILSRSITPGLHFMHGMEFYRIADLTRVWVAAEVSQEDCIQLHPGGSAQLRLRDDGRRFSARITESLPQSEPGGSTVKIRLEAQNRTFLLRPEMLVEVEVPIRVPPAVTVPLDALVDSGAHARVYVQRGEGIFEPREVQTGWRSGGRVQILHGVSPGESVVASATFLVDSESRLKTPVSMPVSMPERLTAKAAGRHSGSNND